MNIEFIKKKLYDLWFLGYRECPYSGTVSIQLLSPTSQMNILDQNMKI